MAIGDMIVRYITSAKVSISNAFAYFSILKLAYAYATLKKALLTLALLMNGAKS